jgi:hypothetical protein
MDRGVMGNEANSLCLESTKGRQLCEPRAVGHELNHLRRRALRIQWLCGTDRVRDSQSRMSILYATPRIWPWWTNANRKIAEIASDA